MNNVTVVTNIFLNIIGQKAWRKKQVCYKLSSKDSCAKAVTDIIICSRMINKDSNLAPIGFSAAG